MGLPRHKSPQKESQSLPFMLTLMQKNIICAFGDVTYHSMLSMAYFFKKNNYKLKKNVRNYLKIAILPFMQ